MRHMLTTAGLCLFASVAAAQDKPVLTVYTYDSFVSDWGPGPAIETAFEAQCNCDLQLVGAGDGAALLARLQLEGARTKADVVLGLDTNLTQAAADTGLFAAHGIEGAEFTLPVAWEDAFFLPYDWGYFAFVHNADMADVPASFAELAASEAKVIIQDPRSSTPGLGLMLWVKASEGEKAGETWADLADNIVTVTKGWSEAYGLFLEGEADMVLSYTTSPAYHLIAEQDASKAAAVFEDGHYMQIEVAGKIASTKAPELADQFLAFMLTDAFQSVIPTTNWMYPAVMPEAGLPEGFGQMVAPETAIMFPASQVPAIRAEALEEWRTALSQ